MTTVGIILAAGQSRRFGTDNKLLAEYCGKTLCSHAAEAMRKSKVDHHIACIADDEVQDHFQGFQCVRCEGGQSDSLKRGVEAAIEKNADQIVVTLADMPNISSGIIDQLLELPEPIAASFFNDNAPMVPAKFPKSLFDQLKKLKGDQGAREILAVSKEIGKVHLTASEILDIDYATDLNLKSRFV